MLSVGSRGTSRTDLMRERNVYGTLMTTMKEGEENECFHDSLDRLLSSSNTSCSCSPNVGSDSEDDHSFDYDLAVAPRFPVGVSKDYDIWILQPSSVQERRLKLMGQMGLTRDPSLLKHRPSLSLSMSNFGMEQFSGNFCSGNDNFDDDCGKIVGDSRGIVRSRSDGDFRNPRGLGKHDNDPDTKVLPSKPPRVKTGVECTRVRAKNSEGIACDGVEDPASGGVCMIKNLDNGKEFVVDEVREDGMWEKIKEVGTGRHLTMEEFSTEMCIGTSPIVQELMRRQSFEDGNSDPLDSANDGSRSKMTRPGNWLRSIRNVASSVRRHKERRSSDERDTSSEKGGRRSSSATDDSQESSFHEPERVRVKQYGKSVKDLTGLYKSQEIQAHDGSIWAIKFSLDGKCLASAGEDCVIHVWKVVETERKGEFCFDKSEDASCNVMFLGNGSSETSMDGHTEKKRRGRSSISRKSVSFEQILVPETVFALLETPVCSFQGHLADVLDLSWSKSQQLLSSSMDKTVRLWDLSCKACLKIFSHNDYVTCIQFNPVDDRYFISGSLDAKVRIWSIPDHQVIDWTDLHEMVTAASYTPDGRGALVGSYKGSCRLFNTSENKLQPKNQINLQNKNKKSHKKKITGFQFAPGSTSEVLITSADSRVRVVNGVDLVHKFKGFHNTSSQISASLSSNGRYVISASEDSYVYVWRHEVESQPNKPKGVTVTQSYEFFHCQDVSVAIPWTSFSPPNSWAPQDSSPSKNNSSIQLFEDVSSPFAEDSNGSGSNNSPINGTVTKFSDNRISATWPEEKLAMAAKSRSPHRVSVDYSNGLPQNDTSAWGMVIVTAGLRGDIRTFQNFGLNVRN